MLSLYNTLSKKKEVFESPKDGPIRLYTCGPTVYDYVHIGNLRSYVAADTLRRVLEASGLEVRHVKNITDVGHLTADDIAQGDSGEDKIAKKALAEHKSPAEIAAFYTDYYRQAEATLNILPAHIEPHATEYVPQMITFINGLIGSGHAYKKNGNVFFDVRSFDKYGALSGNTLEKLKVGARLEEHPDKRNPWDFALWLKAPEGHLMHWDSPWGVGYPGWHIECSAMNLATLGPTIDIHTGGEDNIFPHHEAEIAQSECGNGVPFARYWIHTRHLLVDGQKMSKSKGNFYRLEDIIERGYSAMDLRMLFLSAHYRSQMNFTWEALAQAKKNKESLVGVINRLQTLEIRDSKAKENNVYPEELDNPNGLDGSDYLSNIQKAVDDDLNTSESLSLALELSRKVNAALDSNELVKISVLKDVFKKIFFLFGLTVEDLVIPETIQSIVKARQTAREKKDFARSDALRDEIAALGYAVEDGPEGQTVRKR